MLPRRGSDLVKAAAAIDRAVESRQEWDHSWRAALGARHLMHFTRRLAIPLASAGRATRGASLGIVHEPLFAIKFSLGRTEDEFSATVPADDRFITRILSGDCYLGAVCVKGFRHGGSKGPPILSLSASYAF